MNRRNNDMFKRITNNELKNIKGGTVPLVPVIIGGVLTNIEKQAFDHADQISKGFKKGWNNY